MTHRSRLCHFVIDVGDLDVAVSFWGSALHAIEESVNEGSQHVYRRLVLPESATRVLLHLTSDDKSCKSSMHLDIETDDVAAEVDRLESIGAARISNQTERGYNFWVMADPWGNEFCVLQVTFPKLLAGVRS